MDVREMHIEVMQATQKLAANKTRKLLPEEIDWLLNKCLGRFVQSRVTPKKDGSGGFEIKSFDVDAIRAIMATGVEVPAFIADPRRYQTIIPGDCAYFISDESVIKRPNQDDQLTTNLLSQNLLAFPVRKSLVPTGPWYTSASITINDAVAFDLVTYVTNRDASYSGFSSPQLITELAAVMLRALCDAGWDAYWESYGDIFMPRTLIVNTGAGSMAGSISIDAITLQGLQSAVSVQANDYPQRQTQDSSNRLTASNVIDNLREVAFYRTQAESPLSMLAGNKVYTYADKTFIVTTTRLSYVRKHKRISLILGDDCELAPEFHQLVCDLTEEYYKQMIADPNWETKLKDDMVRTTQ